MTFNPEANAQNQLLTVKDLAAWLQLRPATLYAWAASGRIPSLRLEGRVRFRRDDVLKWLEARKEG